MKELEDYHWFPQKLREFQGAFIGYVVYQSGMYKPIMPVIEDFIRSQKITQIVDLCSGSGLPSFYVKENLTTQIPIILTDKFPLQNKREEKIEYDSNSIDVLTLDFEKNKLYTMYNAFHHFTKAEQEQIIRNAANAKASLLIVELLTPNIITFLQVIITSTIGQLLLTPFIKPFSWLRLLLTYIVPINLITVTVDGIISAFKSKTQKKYHHQFKKITTTDYAVETNCLFRLGNKLILITAKPIH